MELVITGDQREVANSAWISTVSERRAATRTDEDVERVVSFLVEHHHTSPFESVTLSFLSTDDGGEEALCLNDYGRSLFARVSVSDKYQIVVTIDLLNFVKQTKALGLEGSSAWKLFESKRPDLARQVSAFEKLKAEYAEDVSKRLGTHNMAVELISLHDLGDALPEHSRATWRVRCPLSIAVQILRHRTGSYNMVSGRYKTIFQELMDTPDDCSEIAAKFGEDLDRYLGVADGSIARYKQFMRSSKVARDNGVISNDEYKRLREVARFILPEGRMTELYITYYLSDFYNNFLKLRDSEHAQTEHIWIAQEMRRTLEEAQG